ncbi:MAG: DUF11 domain-containing protein [Phycisphaerales bacterium]|nr:DUF11 domain-containing protein [Phycisphaerales bacterium]
MDVRSRRKVGRWMVVAVLNVGGLMTTPANAQTGPFIPADPPYMANGLPGVMASGSNQILVDTTGDGAGDHPYDLTDPAIQPNAAYSLQYQLSPQRDTLITRKIGTGVCPDGSVRIYFHHLDPPPSSTMHAFTGDQGVCIPGGVAQGPRFYDKQPTDPVRTCVHVGFAYPVGTPSGQALLWADLVGREVNLDASTYNFGMNPVMFAPAGDAAFVVTTNFPRAWHIVDLCASPIGGTAGIGSGQAPQIGTLTAEVATGTAGNLLALVRRDGGSPPIGTVPLDDCVTVKACCLPDGTCGLFSGSDCAQMGGQPVDAADCSGVDCMAAYGACCVNNACLVTTQADCTGSYAGDGTTCPDPACTMPEETEACCVTASGECLDVTVSQCAAFGGTSAGSGSSCATESCPPPPGTEACCLSLGCLNMDQANCVNFNGIPQGPGSNCYNAGTMCPSAELTISKSAPTSVQEGGQFTYVITYGNNGPDLSFNASVIESLPAETTLVSASDAPGGGPPTINGNLITWSVGNLAPGASNQVTCTVSVGCGGAGGVITNQLCRIVGGLARCGCPGHDSPAKPHLRTDRLRSG